MRRFISGILMLSILFSSLGSGLLVIHYLMNKEYYATVLCENVDKPKMKCHGTCQLQKEIKEQEKNEKGPLASLKLKHEAPQLFVQAIKSVDLSLEVKPKYGSFILVQDPVTFHHSIFQPPRV